MTLGDLRSLFDQNTIPFPNKWTQYFPRHSHRVKDLQGDNFIRNHWKFWKNEKIPEATKLPAEKLASNIKTRLNNPPIQKASL